MQKNLKKEYMYIFQILFHIYIYIYIYIYKLNHFAVHLNLTQNCKSITLQEKKNKKSEGKSYKFWRQRPVNIL